MDTASNKPIKEGMSAKVKALKAEKAKTTLKAAIEAEEDQEVDSEGPEVDIEAEAEVVTDKTMTNMIKVTELKKAAIEVAEEEEATIEVEEAEAKVNIVINQRVLPNQQIYLKVNKMLLVEVTLINQRLETNITLVTEEIDMVSEANLERLIILMIDIAVLEEEENLRKEDSEKVTGVRKRSSIRRRVRLIQLTTILKKVRLGMNQENKLKTITKEIDLKVDTEEEEIEVAIEVIDKIEVMVKIGNIAETERIEAIEVTEEEVTEEVEEEAEATEAIEVTEVTETTSEREETKLRRKKKLLVLLLKSSRLNKRISTQIF